MVLPQGARLGPYEIDSLIGSGSMGQVYKARDSRLNRTVALKQITIQHSERFETEARAIAALNHPHICQIYDVGPDFLVLEYLHGEPLRGPVTPDDAVRLAIQIADALEAAHERGILHRDLKPANVMVIRRGGTVTAKLLDFGVARLLGPDAGATTTSAGDLVGTPAYMSPEQAQGQPLDERSDVFSFGAVLYELISGRRAFTGHCMADVLSAVLRDEPRPLDVPIGLQRLVTRCLAKDPGRRFQSMRAVTQALQEARLDGEDAPSSIAVLPFANMSPDKENEYFADGLAEEIINALAQIGDLKVIARTSAFSFKGRNEDIRQIAQTLGVTHVLEGSVRRAADRVRVTAQLIAASDGAHLYSERFDRPMTDVFAMQDEIAQAITTALKGRLRRPSSPGRQHTPRIDAYESFLRGRAQLTRFSPDAWDRAKAHFDRAIALDPQYEEPHVELALGYFIVGMHGMRPMRDVVPFVRSEVARAMELNPADPRPRFLLGALALAHDYDWAAAGVHFAASMAAPNVTPEARWVYAGLYLRGLGRFEEASQQMIQVVEADPLNPTWHAILSAHLLDVGRFDQAIAAGKKAVELEPHYFLGTNLLGEAYSASGRAADALAAFERAYELAPWSDIGVGRLAAALWQQGQRPRAEALIGEMANPPSQMWGRAVYHLLTGDLDAAAEWYERMIEQRDPFALIYARASITQPLREHPRWTRLAQLMRFTAE